MGSKKGFEYRNRIWMDEEILSRYDPASLPRSMRLLFEIRTNFTVKRRSEDGGVDEVKIDSEMYDACSWEKGSEFYLSVAMGYRLRDYWMSEDEIQELVHKAMDFANQRAAQYVSYPIIPIAVEIDVCTVQQEGEPINATLDRAIRSECLFPLDLFQINQASVRNGCKSLDVAIQKFLREDLPQSTIRVEDIDEGFLVMKECNICLRKPTIGAQITSLRCGHVFHYHCIARLLEHNRLCPVCLKPAHDFMGLFESFLRKMNL